MYTMQKKEDKQESTFTLAIGQAKLQKCKWNVGGQSQKASGPILADQRPRTSHDVQSGPQVSDLHGPGNLDLGTVTTRTKNVYLESRVDFCIWCVKVAVGNMFSEWRVWLSQTGVTEVLIESVSHGAGALAYVEMGLTLQ